jgi:CubicO group peptidase (beta-lactamase class C family)
VNELEGSIERLAHETAFSGVVRVDRAEQTLFVKAYGRANRAAEIANTEATQFGLASGTKGFTALTIVSLIEEGRVAPSTAARSILGDDLPLIDDDVTVEQLLAHRSGIGDYFDEEIERPITDYVTPVPVHRLDSMEAYVEALDGFPQKSSPGERFAYCNSGYVVLALIAERVAGVPFHELVVARVCAPAGMPDTHFLRSDALPGGAAIGYLDDEGLRSNVLHLPVLGGGDGGLFSTATDIRALWEALFAGRIVSPEWVARMVHPHSDVPSNSARYGLGFWLHASGPAAELHGYDAGVSFRSVHDPVASLTHTVLSNTSEGAWAITELLDELVSA